MLGNEITPKHDSTLGLIFRLNGLWAEVDGPAKNGEYDSWNNVLDRIYCNLLYRNSLKIEKDDDGNIKSVKLSSEDEEIYRYLSAQVSKYQILYSKVKGKNKNGVLKKKIVRSLWYKALMMKDIWLRKFMRELNLYVKETKKTPGHALFGN